MRIRRSYIGWRCVHGSMYQVTAAFICATILPSLQAVTKPKEHATELLFHLAICHTVPPGTNMPQQCRQVTYCALVLLICYRVNWCAIVRQPGHCATTLPPSYLVRHRATTVPPCHRAKVLPCHRATVPPCHCAIVRPCHRVTVSPCHRPTWCAPGPLPWYRFTWFATVPPPLHHATFCASETLQSHCATWCTTTTLPSTVQSGRARTDKTHRHTSVCPFPMHN